MMYNEQIEKQVIGRLKVDNPWWTEVQFLTSLGICLLVCIWINFIHLLLKQVFVELSY